MPVLEPKSGEKYERFVSRYVYVVVDTPKALLGNVVCLSPVRKVVKTIPNEIRSNTPPDGTWVPSRQSRVGQHQDLSSRPTKYTLVLTY